MRATTPGFSLTLVLLAGACAGAEMNRASGDGDDVGESANDETSDDDDDDDDSDPSDASTSADEVTTDDPDSTDPTDATDPTDPTDPLEGSTTDPSDTDPTAEGSSGTDPSTSETSDSDAESSSDDGVTTESTTTDATDSETQSSDEVDLSGWLLVQTASAREIVIPDGTIVPVGGYLVIGRDASAATFQNFWGVAWGDDVVYVEGQDNFPTINGAETYTLRDPNNVVVDGPTPALDLSTSAARIDAAMAGTDEDAWESSATPNTTAVPGESVATGGTSGVPYISEYADTTGQGNYGYEFVEVHVPA